MIISDKERLALRKVLRFSLLSSTTLLLSSICAPTAGRAADDESVGKELRSAHQILADFDDGDPGWKVRMQSLVHLTKGGSGGVPTLVDVLHNGTPTQREFAAHALAVMQDPAARSVLEDAAWSDQVPDIVGMYAMFGLGMMGDLDLSVEQRRRLAMGGAGTVGRYRVAALLQEKRPPEAFSLRTTLMNYDLAKLNSARVGQLAPDFVLTSAEGATYQLSRFRGEKIVVLEFSKGSS